MQRMRERDQTLNQDSLSLRGSAKYWMMKRMKVRVAKTAVNMETSTPMIRVMAKPCTTEAPKFEPK